MDTTLAVIVLLPFVGSLAAAFLPSHARNAAAWLSAVTALACVALLAGLWPAVASGEIVRCTIPWVPDLGLEFNVRLDGYAWLFAMLVSVMGALVVLYARYYMSSADPVPRFFAFLLAFMGAMLGMVLSGNLIQLVVFWELTSLTSFMLIAYWYHRHDARRGARMALIVTAGGGFCLLLGVLLLGEIAGSYDLDVILAAGDAIRAHPWYAPALILILLGALTKSAQFPFHFWLPHAMAAPTPVSAYLHSATLVKAGVFLMARLWPVLAGTDAWLLLVGGAGLVTLLFGLQTRLSVVAAVFHIINHATFKASLFMAAGIIDHETGTRDMRKLNGLWKFMPYTGMLAMVAAGAMAGVPLLNGFLSKEMFLAETVHFAGHEEWGILLPVAATLGSVFSVAYSVRFIDDVFFNGEPQGLDKVPHEPPRWMRMPVEMLVAVCLAVGIFPEYTVAPLLAIAVSATTGGAPLPPYSLAIWHGLNLPLAMSAIALAGGLFAYYFLQRVYNLHRHLHSPVNGHWLYHKALGHLLAFSARLTAGLENNSLQRYLGWMTIGALLMAAWPFMHPGWSVGERPPTAVNAMAVLIWLFLAAAVIAAVALHRQRLVALIMVSTVGLVPALIFAYLSAPDLGLTQVTVEVVTIVLLLLALHWLPQQSPAEPRRGRTLFRAAIALAAGAGIAALSYAVLTRPFQSLSDFYLANSVPGGGGANVVNVILVDFRGYDTFGEIIVLAIAALGIAAMMGKPLSGRRAADWQGRPWAQDAHPMMLSVLASLLLPLALMVAAFIFLRGHNLPGGGFVAGLVTGIALILLYIANGAGWAGARMHLAFAPVIGVGVFIAGLTGIASWLFGQPFLTSAHGHLPLALIGELPLASAMGFDLGVYLTVVGVVMLSLSCLGRAGVASRAENGKGG